MDCRTTSGKLIVNSTAVPNSLTSSMTAGTVSITIPDNTGFSLVTQKTSGSITCDFDLTSRLGGEETTYTYGEGAAAGREYAVRVTSGDFSLLRAA